MQMQSSSESGSCCILDCHRNNVIEETGKFFNMLNKSLPRRSSKTLEGQLLWCSYLYLQLCCVRTVRRCSRVFFPCKNKNFFPCKNKIVSDLAKQRHFTTKVIYNNIFSAGLNEIKHYIDCKQQRDVTRAV